MIKDVPYKYVSLQLKNDCDNDNDKLFIYETNDSTDVIAAERKLGTGMVIKLIKNGRLNDQDDIVVKGEVTGDGEIMINDVVRTVNAFVGLEDLTGIWFEAADVTSDGSIMINDVVSVVNLYVEE